MTVNQENNIKEIQNFALKIFLEFGKNFGKDISERLKEKFPDLGLLEIEKNQNICKNIEKECWNSVDSTSEKIDALKLEKILTEKIFKKYKWININNQKRIISQFSYYFWKDGLME